MNLEPVFVGKENGVAAARSEIYRALSDAFVFPHDQERANLVLHEIPAILREYEARLPYRVDALGGVSMVDFTGASLTEAYTGLFDNCIGKAACPLHEKEYVKTDYKQVWEGLIRFYEHFGLTYDLNRSKILPDWISIELEFMHYLSYLEALSADNTKYIAAQRDFLRRHLAAWIPKFCARLLDKGGLTPYGRYATALESFIAADLEFNSSRLPTDDREIGVRIKTSNQEIGREYQ